MHYRERAHVRWTGGELRYRVGSVREVRSLACRVVTIRGRDIGIIAVEDRFVAVTNKCPHRGAPLCEGTIGGTFLPSSPGELVYGMDKRILRCPWHGWEFDVDTGRSLFQPDDVRVKVYRVHVEDDDVFLEV